MRRPVQSSSPSISHASGGGTPMTRRANEAGCDLHLEEPYLEPVAEIFIEVRPVGNAIYALLSNVRSAATLPPIAPSQQYHRAIRWPADGYDPPTEWIVGRRRPPQGTSQPRSSATRADKLKAS